MTSSFYLDISIINCHYPDDTILFLKATHVNMTSAWWEMNCFEALSGIKTNLLKTKLYPIHTSGEEYASTFKCKVGK